MRFKFIDANTIIFFPDRNECLEWGFCEQLCTNVDGSYTCSCAPGYTRQGKNKCRASGTEPLELLVAQERNIWRLIPGSDERHLISNTTGASGLDYHLERNLLFWSDVKTRKIHSQSLKGASFSSYAPLSELLLGRYSFVKEEKKTMKKQKGIRDDLVFFFFFLCYAVALALACLFAF